MKKYTWAICCVILFSASALPLQAEESTEQRLNRLERLINSKGLVDIMVRVESLQSELQRLQGEIEVQKYTLDEIKKRQRDLYLDIDRRLLQLERRSGTSMPSVPPASTTTVPAAAAETTEPASPEMASQPPAATQPQTVVRREGEQVAYQKAFDLLRALRYEKATQAFRQFLNDYPDGRYAHIAQYWLAETSYHTRKFKQAIDDYQTLLNKYPKSPKRADALLKIGYSQYELKSYGKAKEVLQTLIKTYPGTTEAGQAENLLRKIRSRTAG